MEIGNYGSQGETEKEFLKPNRPSQLVKTTEEAVELEKEEGHLLMDLPASMRCYVHEVMLGNCLI